MPPLPVLDGASASVQFEVLRTKTAKTGIVRFHQSIVDGVVVDSAKGEADEPDFTVVVTRAELRALCAGDLPLDVGYMQGRVKVTGNVGRLLSVLPVLLTDEWVTSLGETVAAIEGLEP